MNSTSNWLKQSQSVRQARLHKLNEFTTFVQTQSTPPTQIQSPFLKKYEYAQSKLLQLQKQLNGVRISPPSPHVNERKRISKKENTHFFPNDTNIVPPSHTQSETFPKNDTNVVDKINKSQSTSILTNNMSLAPLQISQHSHSHESLLPNNKNRQNHESISTSSESNPYSMTDIHPSLINKANFLQPNTSNHSSSTSIRSQLLNQYEKQKQEKMRRSLMELQSTSELHSKSGSISISNSSTNISANKSKRKSPRKLTAILSPSNIDKNINKKGLFHQSKSLFIKTNKANKKLSVSFVDVKKKKINNTIDKVRQSIIFEHLQENDDDENISIEQDTKSMFSSPRSLMSPTLKSQKHSYANSVVNDDDDKRSDITVQSMLSPSSVMSRRSTVYDLVDESERIIEDKQSNINTYRQSVLFQLKDAENKKQIVLKERENNNIAIQFFKNTLKHKIIIAWRQYTENEIIIGYKYQENKITLKCWNEWKRMCLIVCMIKKKRYLKIWKDTNCDTLLQIEQLLDFPTKSRWIFLKIISLMRLLRNSSNKKRYKIIINRLFSRYGIIILFVFFCSWRTLAQEKNIAAFNIIKLIKKSDQNIMIRNLRIWRLKTKKSKLKRCNAFEAARKLHLQNIYKRYLKNWMSMFIHESMIKIALFHWCNKLEQNIFNKWINYTNWSIKSKIKSDKLYKITMFNRYFTFWIDEMLRIQNERQWKAWREANKAVKNVNNNDNDDKKEKTILKNNSYFCNVQSTDPPQNIFFPYYGLSDSQIKKEMSADLNEIPEKNDERLSYVKHCELQQILIPMYK